MSSFPHRPVLLSLSLLIALGGCAANDASHPSGHVQLKDGATAQVAILETTDVHFNALSYDYYKQREDDSVGYERLATLIHQARKEFPNTLLFDDGDTIQGTVLADYQAKVKPLPCDQELGIYKALDTMGYDGGTIGNHEFNYGLPYLSQVTGTPMNVEGVDTGHCVGPHYPLVLSNVVSARDHKPIFKPWTIITKQITVTGVDGKTHQVPLRVGIIGFAPPPIMVWDKQNLQGKVTVTGVVETAKKYLPEIKAEHPDLVVALVHGGLSTAPYTPETENAGLYVAAIPGIDAMLLGHQHAELPGPHFAGIKDVDVKRGFVHGVPTVMGGSFGKDLGVIDLKLTREAGHWVVDKSATHSEVRPICKAKGDCVPADPEIAPLVAKAHQAAIDYVNTPIGHTEVQLSSYFADEGNSTALAVVNSAQQAYVQRELPKLHPELAGVPVLSAASSFRTGFGGPDDYTDVPVGEVTLRNAADLYFFPNTLAAVKTDGAGVKAWLEKSAERYATLDPGKSGEQPLINDRYVAYNVDQIQGGLHYVIDLSKPAGQRITKLTYQGKPVTPEQPFVVATNNYRADGGGHFPGMDGNNIVMVGPDGNREILADWIKRKGTLTAKDIEPTSWSFAPIKAKGPITFGCAANKIDVAQAVGLDNIRQLKTTGNGKALCAIDLSR